MCSCALVAVAVAHCAAAVWLQCSASAQRLLSHSGKRIMLHLFAAQSTFKILHGNVALGEVGALGGSGLGW